MKRQTHTSNVQDATKSLQRAEYNLSIKKYKDAAEHAELASFSLDGDLYDRCIDIIESANHFRKKN